MARVKAIYERWRARADRGITGVRQRVTFADVLGETISGYRRNRLGRVAALLAHYGFLSIFPLLACFSTVLAFVLQDNKALQESIVDSTISQIPVIGQQLQADPTSLQGSGFVLIASLLIAIWAGLKAFVVAQTAIDDIDGLERHQRLGAVGGRLRALAIIVVIGVSQTITAVAAGFLSASGLRLDTKSVLLLVSVLLNIGLVGITFELLSTMSHSWREIAPGAAFTGSCYGVLQLVGTVVVGRAIIRATPMYGTFATVIGLLTWLSLHAVLALIGYQLNVVLAERRARSLPLAPARSL